MSRRPYAYDLDRGTAEPLPPKVEAWLDTHDPQNRRVTASRKNAGNERQTS